MRRMGWDDFFSWLYDEGNRCEYPRLCATQFNDRIRISSTAFGETTVVHISRAEFLDQFTRSDQETLGREALGKLRQVSRLGDLL